MSADGSITLAWGDGEYRFRLGIGELRELETKCNAGPFEVYRRLADGTWRVDDVREPIRLGLIGAGLDPNRALGKIGRYFGPALFLENVTIARAVMLAALFGDPADTVGKIQAAAIERETSTIESGGLASSETPPQWDGPSPTSTPAHFGNSPPRWTDGTPVTAVSNSSSSR